jgi:lipopolysaccharide export system permease protein
LDTLINLNTTELGRLDQLVKTMNFNELNGFIAEQKDKGSDMMALFEVERQSRFSYPVAIFILTLIGVSLSSRKVRGGTGLHMGLGIGLCFTYILFSRFAEEFAKGGIMPAALSVWIPNIVFAAIAVYLYIKAPK